MIENNKVKYGKRERFCIWENSDDYVVNWIEEISYKKIL